MRQLITNIPLTACALASALLVSACGGGGASAPAAVVGSSGFAVDDYLSAATTLCDSNANGQSDAGEATTVTDSSGFFKFATACTSTIVVTGGTNIDTGLPFVGKLKAPAGSTMVTPLTTLMVEGMTMDQINAALGLPAGTNVATLDPARKIGGVLQNADLFRKTLAMQQLLQKTAETLAALVPQGNAATMYGEAAAAMAAVLRTNPTLVTGGAVDSGALAALAEAAAARVQASLGSDINAASLGQIMAGALKVQADRILAATDAELTATTLAEQGNSQISEFVLANTAGLASAPGVGTASLATQLTELIASGGVVTPPPPPASGTLLLSFDETTPVFTGMGAYGGALPEVVAGPSGGSGSALKITKPAGTEAWGGVYFGLPAIAFTSDRKVVSARVYSTRANAVIKFKVEVAGGVSTEVASSPVPANTWTTVSWDMTGIDLSKGYNVIAITPDQDVVASGQSYFVDDITLAAAAVVTPPVTSSCATSTEQCISFSETTVAAIGFEGLVSAAVANDPVAGASNKVLKMVKGPSGQPWAGATVFTMGTVNADPSVRSVLTIDTVGLSSNKIVTLRNYSGAPVGTKITLKLENGIDPGQNIAAETVTTKQNEWETLTFNFANLSTGVFSSATTYNTASIFPAFSIPGAVVPLASETSFYFDELKYAVAGSTVTPPPPPATGGSVLASFDEATPPAVIEFGGAGYAVAAGPAGGTGNALRITRNGGEAFAGAWIAVAAIPNNAGAQTVSARVYSPTAGVPIVAKAEFGDNAGTGDVQANEAVIAGWQTLTWTFTNLAAPNVYNRFTILPNLGTVDTAKDYFFDNITLVAANGGGGGGSVATPITFSSGFAGNARTVEGGEFGGFGGSNLDGFQCNGQPASCGGGGDVSPVVAAADSYFYYYYQTPTPATALYAGIYVLAPGVTGGLSATADTAGVAIAGQTTMKFNFNPNPEWYGTATNNFMVQLDLGKLYTPNGNACHIQLRKVVTPTSAASAAYTLNLNTFTVVQDCAVPGITTAAALAGSPISQVSFQAAGGGSAVGDGSLTTGANLIAPANGVYPTTVVVKGAITFE